MRQRCCVSCVTVASNRYWLTVGQGLISLQQVRVEGVCFIMPSPFSMGGGEGGAYSITTVSTCFRTSAVRPYVPYKNGFCSIPFEKISVLDSYFIHRYIIIKCRSFDLGKIHQLLWELWPFFNFEKWFSFDSF